MTENTFEKECPSHEQLSAYFDKESKLPEAIEKHLKQCPECRNYLDSLARIDYSIKHVVSAETGGDDEIAKRILARVKASVDEERKLHHRKFFLTPIQWRVAVLLMIGCSIGYLLWEESRQEKPKPQTGVLESANVPAVFSSNTRGRAVQMNELEAIHFSPNGEELKSLKHGETALPINLVISHVWSLPENVKSFTNLINKHNIPENALVKKENVWILSCEMDKLQLVKFVHACSAAGFQLLSPDQPQPEQKSFLGSPKEKVHYTAKFIVN